MFKSLLKKFVSKVNSKYEEPVVEVVKPNIEYTPVLNRAEGYRHRISTMTLPQLTYVQLRSWQATTYTKSLGELIQLSHVTAGQLALTKINVTGFNKGIKLNDTPLHDWLYSENENVNLGRLIKSLVSSLEDLVIVMRDTRISESNADRLCLALFNDLDEVESILSQHGISADIH